MLDLDPSDAPIDFISSTDSSRPNVTPAELSLETGVAWLNHALNEELEQLSPIESGRADTHAFDFTAIGINLSSQDEKMLRKLRSTYNREVTVAWVAELSVWDFGRKRSVGETYTAILVSLQERVRKALARAIGSSRKSSPASCKPHSSRSISNLEAVSPTASSEYRIAIGRLEGRHQKLLRKLAKVFGRSIEQISVPWLLSLDGAAIQAMKGVGETYIEAFLDLRKQVHHDLRKCKQAVDSPLLPSGDSVAAGTIDHPSIAVSRSSKSLKPAELEKTLVADFERLLFRLDKRSREIALARWGYHEPRQKLKSIGNKLGLTRERVRQIADDTNSSIPECLSLTPEAVWDSVKPYLEHDLLTVFPNLASCFTPSSLVFDFLERCCDVPKNSVKETQCVNDVDVHILDAFFTQTASPVSEEACYEELTSGCGMNVHRARNTFRQLARHDHIRITDKGVFPKSLKKMDAIAHVLVKHTKGLPWKDITRIINANRFAATKISEERMNSGFQQNVHTYLYGLGTYRHLKFFGQDECDVLAMIEKVRDCLLEHRLPNTNLPVIHHHLKDTLNVDYYTLRYVVSTFGEEKGVYFVGRSGVDSVSLEVDAPHMNLDNVIFRILQRAVDPMTIYEIAKQTRSKSYPLTAIHVNALQKAGSVARIDRNMYTTVESAFDGVDRQAIATIIDGCLRESALPVEADVFREQVNPTLQLSHSKYFYNALAETLAADYGWYFRRTLFSSNQLAYEGLRDLFRRWFDPALSNEDNLRRIREHVWISNNLAANMIRGWMSAERAATS